MEKRPHFPQGDVAPLKKQSRETPQQPSARHDSLWRLGLNPGAWLQPSSEHEYQIAPQHPEGLESHLLSQGQFLDTRAIFSYEPESSGSYSLSQGQSLDTQAMFSYEPESSGSHSLSQGQFLDTQAMFSYEPESSGSHSFDPSIAYQLEVPSSEQSHGFLSQTMNGGNFSDLQTRDRISEIMTINIQIAIDHLHSAIGKNKNASKKRNISSFSNNKIKEIKDMANGLKLCKSLIKEKNMQEADKVYAQIQAQVTAAQEAQLILKTALAKIEGKPSRHIEESINGMTANQVDRALKHLYMSISRNKNRAEKREEYFFGPTKTQEIKYVINGLKLYKSLIKEGNMQEADRVYAQIQAQVTAAQEAQPILKTALAKIEGKPSRHIEESINGMTANQVNRAIDHLNKSIGRNKYQADREKSHLFSPTKTQEIKDTINGLKLYKSLIKEGNIREADKVYAQIQAQAAAAQEAQLILKTALTGTATLSGGEKS